MRKRYFVKCGSINSETIGPGNLLHMNDLMAQHHAMLAFEVGLADPAIVFEQIGRNPPEPVAVWSRSQ